MLWTEIFAQAIALAERNSRLSTYLRSVILDFNDLTTALSFHLHRSLSSHAHDTELNAWFYELMSTHPAIVNATECDLRKLVLINPACPDELTGLLSFRGILALTAQRLSHQIWKDGDKQSAVLLQNWSSQQWNIDIHPAAIMGKGLFVDHGIGIVIGETAVVEDDVSIWHGVTLGSTLMQAGDRHPKIGRGALLCASATILGNIDVGAGAIVAANSVVTKPVPEGVIVAGCPAKVLGPVPQALDTLTTKCIKE